MLKVTSALLLCAVAPNTPTHPALLSKIMLPLAFAFSFRAPHACASTQPHTLLGSALGLLLVFRTNAAYQRFQEGRKLWEEVVNVSRDIARMTHLYEDGEAHLMGWPAVLGRSPSLRHLCETISSSCDSFDFWPVFVVFVACRSVSPTLPDCLWSGVPCFEERARRLKNAMGPPLYSSSHLSLSHTLFFSLF